MRIMIMMYCAGTSSGGAEGEKGTWRIHRAVGNLNL